MRLEVVVEAIAYLNVTLVIATIFTVDLPRGGGGNGGGIIRGRS